MFLLLLFVLLFIDLSLILFCEGRYGSPGLHAKRPLVRLPHGKHYISMQARIFISKHSNLARS